GPQNREQRRWPWFRRYLQSLTTSPFRVLWQGLPNQSDFFADFPPVRDTAVAPDRRAQETDARRQRYLLVLLGRWLANLPLRVREIFATLVAYVRAKEDYPSPWLLRQATFWAWGARALATVTWHLLWRPSFFNERAFAEATPRGHRRRF